MTARTRLNRPAPDVSEQPTTIHLSFYTLEPRLAGLVDAARKRGVESAWVDRIEQEMCALVDALISKAAEAQALTPFARSPVKKARRGRHEAWLKRQLDKLGEGGAA